MSSTTQRTAIVTGAARGIGAATAIRLAADGHAVAVLDLDENACADTVSAISSAGGRAIAVGVDVSRPEQVEAAVARVADELGAPTILVNNAGIIRDNQLAALDDDDIRVVLDTNIGGVFNITRAVIPHMIVQRSGKIINLSSVSAEKGGRGQTNYAASKGAINAFTRSLAVELAPRKITVNAVAPGVIETEMSKDVRDLAGDQVKSRILLKRYGKPEEVAYAVWFLASRYADYMTGQVVAVDGGFKME
jgi:3-oxoacyl-[acyl-carrier protein] reductase